MQIRVLGGDEEVKEDQPLSILELGRAKAEASNPIRVLDESEEIKLPDKPLGNIETERRKLEHLTDQVRLPERIYGNAIDWLGEGLKQSIKGTMRSSEIGAQHEADDDGDDQIIMTYERRFTPGDRMRQVEHMNKLLAQGYQQHDAWKQSVLAVEDGYQGGRQEVARSIVAQKESFDQRRTMAASKAEQYHQAAESIKLDPKESSGPLEDLVTGVGAMAPSIALSLIHPSLGIAQMWSYMRGATYDNLVENGVDHQRAYHYADMDATVQMPLEAFGELSILKSMVGRKGLGHLVRDVGLPMLTEGATEFVQNYPDTAFTYAALHPDCSLDELQHQVFSSKTLKDSLYQAALGAATGGVFAGVGRVATMPSGRIESLISDKQRRINEERINALGEINAKVQRGEEVSDADLNLLDTAMQHAGIRREVYFQTPIESDSRARINQTIATRYGDKAPAIMRLYDGIVRSVAEHATANEGREVTPAEIYDQIAVENTRWQDFNKQQKAAAQFQRNPDLNPADLVNVVAVQPRFANRAAGWEVRKLDKQVLKEIGSAIRGEHRNDNTGWTIGITGTTTNHLTKAEAGTSRDAVEHFEAIAALPQLIKHAVLGETHADRKGQAGIAKIHRLFAPLRINDQTYTVKLTVKEYEPGKATLEGYDVKKLYDHAIVKTIADGTPVQKEDAGTSQAQDRGQTPGPAAASHSVNVRDLLSDVNIDGDSGTYYQDNEPSRSSVENAIAGSASLYQNAWHYSQLERVAESKLPPSAKPAEMIKAFKAWAAGGEIKAEELDYAGVLDWLKTLDEPRVNRETVLDYLGANHLEFDEITRAEGQTKYVAYRMPDGQNYREVLLSLPERLSGLDDGEWSELETLLYTDPAERSAAQRARLDDLAGRQRAYSARPDDGWYSSPHWNEPNVLAHVRLSDHQGEHGHKVLLIEEIQSDWHQEGRRKGYGREGVPDAPFKKTWPLLAFKRIMAEAVAGGYDAVAWTTGSQQAERYDLSKQVAALRYRKSADGTYAVTARIDVGGHETNETLGDALTEADLEAQLGKEITKRIVANHGQEVSAGGESIYRELTGLDLKVGGEGMAGFYDKILPSEVKGFFCKAKYGKPKLGDVTLENGEAVHALKLTDEVREKLGKEGLPLFQRSAAPKGATSILPDGRYLVSLFEQADVSTAVHEVGGHVLLPMIQRYSPQDFAAVCEWLDVPTDLMATDPANLSEAVRQRVTEAHEKFARGFEVYCMEGKAPTFRLQQVFAQLKSWMLRIYRSIKNLNVDLNPEIRDVFDRWVSTEDERLNDPVYEMESWWNVDDVMAADSRQTAEDQYSTWESIQASARKIMADQTGGERARLEREMRTDCKRQAAADIHEDKFYTTLTALRKLGGFSEKHLIEARNWSKDEMAFLKKHRLVGKNSKIQPDQFCWENGFESVDDFMDLVFDGRQLAKGAAINDRAESYFYDWQQSVGHELDLTSDLEAQLNAEIAVIERVLKRKAPVNRLKAADIKKLTGQTTSEEYKALKQQFAELEKASRAAWNESRKVAGEKHAEELLELKAKQQAIVQRLKDYNKERFEMDKIRRKLWDVARQKNLLPDYRDQIHHLLAQYRLGSLEMKPEFAQLPDLRAFIDRVIKDDEAKGPGKLIMEALPDPRVGAEGESLRQDRWTKAELEAVEAMADYLRHQSSSERYLNSAEFKMQVGALTTSMRKRRGNFGGNSARQERKLLNELARQLPDGRWVIEEEQGVLGEALIASGQNKRECVDRALEHYRASVPGAEELWNQGEVKIYEQPTKGERLATLKDKYIATTLKIGTIARMLDGYEDFGPVYQATQRPMNEAWRTELDMLRDYHGRLRSIFKPFLTEKGWAAKKYKIAGVSQMLTKEQMIMIALNSGNEGNIRAVLGGVFGVPDKIIRNKNIDIFEMGKQMIDPVITSLSEDEYRLVKDVWTLIDEFYEPLNAVHRELAGVNLPKVEGHYFPLVFDPRLSLRARKNEDIKSLNDLSYSPYFVTNPEAGHRKTRLGGVMPLRLDFGVIGNHIDNCCHDITHSVTVRDVARLTGAADFRETVSQILGEPYYDQFKPWLSNVARPNRNARSVIEKTLAKVRRNTSVVALAYNVGVATMQSIGITQSVHELGRWRVVQGLIDFYADPREMAEFIQNKSILMAHRSESFDRDMRELSRQLSATVQEKAHEKMLEHGFTMISMMDMAVSFPTWIAAYRKGLVDFVDEQGNPDEIKAIEYADDVVERTQAAAAPKDMAAVQTGMVGKAGGEGSELIKLTTMFYSSFSTVQQRLFETVDRAQLGQYTSGDVLKSFWLQMLVPAALTVVIKGALHGELPDDPLDFLKEVCGETAGYAVAGLPFFRDILSPALTGYDYRFSPAVEGLNVLARLIKTTKNMPQAAIDPNSDINLGQLGKDCFRTAGYFYGLPTNQAMVTIDGAIDLINGDTRNPLRLLVRGAKN